jgi:cysteine desulfuration protein SufE
METSTIPTSYRNLAEQFSILPDGDERLMFLIDLGRKLPPIEESHQTEDNLVPGCISSVWLVCERKVDGGNGNTTLHFRGQSDAQIVSGLVTIVLARYSGLTPEDVLSVDTDSILQGFDLQNHLSTGRQNGLASMVDRIRKFAVEAMVPEGKS